MSNINFEVLIVGGGMAGMALAQILGRANVSACVIDSGEGHTANTHNFLTRDGVTKQDLAHHAQKDLEKYKTIKHITAKVSAVSKQPFGFSVTLQEGQEISSIYMVLATGANIIDPIFNTAGAQEVWTKSMFSCPYCHGFEQNGKPIAVLNAGASATRFVKTLTQWTKRITYFTHGDPAPEGLQDFLSLLHPDNKIVTDPIIDFVNTDGQLSGLKLADNTIIPAQVAFLGSLDVGGNQFADTIGAETAIHPKTGKPAYKSDNVGRTTVPDFFMIGDVRSGFSTLTGAAFEGVSAGKFLINSISGRRTKLLEQSAPKPPNSWG